MSPRVSSSPADAASRQRGWREPWPWLLAAGPLLVVVASLVSAWLAMRNEDSLVAEDYYKRGLLINRKLAQEPVHTSPISVALDVDSEGRVRALVDGAVNPAPESLQLRLVHPGDAAHAQTVTLRRTEPGLYTGSLQQAPQGRVLVTLESGDWRLPTTTVSGPLREIHLRSVDAH
jgi:hypothetical protein